jgi:RNA polymerase sigma-70 factor, ECF subfamily
VPKQLSPAEEQSLISRLPQKPEAFRELYRHYAPRVFSYVVYMVGCKQDAEDLTADIFLKIIKAIDRFEYRGKGSFAVWVFRIAHNNVQQFYRKLHGQDILPLDNLPEIQSSSLLPDEHLIRKEEFAHLHQILTTLTPRHREIITLRFFGGLRNQEIALMLSLDERTVASHLSRGLKELERKYQQEEQTKEKVYE